MPDSGSVAAEPAVMVMLAELVKPVGLVVGAPAATGGVVSTRILALVDAVPGLPAMSEPVKTHW
jgi:hypothetical protein